MNRSDLLRRVQERGFESVSQLATEFGVTQSTIRRHLDILQQRGVIERRHGGVAALSGSTEVPYAAKEPERQRQKHAIAMADLATVYVQEGDLDRGTEAARNALDLSVASECRWALERLQALRAPLARSGIAEAKELAERLDRQTIEVAQDG